MAQGDIKAGGNLMANNGTYDIQPPPGEEWVLHNIYYNNPVSFRIMGSFGNVLFDSDTTAGARMGINMHLTNAQYLRIYNAYAGNTTIAYDGVQTK